MNILSPQLKFVDELVFGNLRRLVSLRLDGNQLTVIGSDLFVAQRSLEHLGECVARRHRRCATSDAIAPIAPHIRPN